MKTSFLLFLLLAITGQSAPLPPLVPFAPPWDDAAPGPIDLRNTIPRPAGQSGFISIRDGHLAAGRERLRLFGVNFTSAACMPSHDIADKTASRLPKYGFNAVRLHFLDATWSDIQIPDYATGDTRRFNTNALDRLDYFTARLREHGVYLNINLLVGRRFGLQDGVDPRINQLDWKAAHAIGFFHASHLAAQQDYARRLLTHRNPYTGLTYANDPSVALVEINNENGLLHTWMSGLLNNMPEPFASDLSTQWNTWLLARHHDDAALSKAWQTRHELIGPELLRNGSFANDLLNWVPEQHGSARVAATVTSNIATLAINSTSVEAWHVQLSQSRLAVDSNALYTLSFRARADAARKIYAMVMQSHPPWNPVGLHVPVTITTNWATFQYTFTAQAETNARLCFSSLCQTGAVFQFSDISLRPGGRIGLAEGESLSSRSIHRPRSSDTPAITTPAARAEWIRFLWETERHYWLAMRDFLKNDLKVKVPVVGTIVGCSTPNLMADFDAVDTHAYWEHPRFPGKGWDSSNWHINNISMVDAPAEATVTHLAHSRVAGKPHLVTEYHHPAPNIHAAEAPLFLSAYAALQDWDGIFLYTYAHTEKDMQAGYVTGFFNIAQHPTLWANIPAASLMFRRGDIAPAQQVLYPFLPPEKEIQLIAEQGNSWRVTPVTSLGLSNVSALQHRIALNLKPGRRATSPSYTPPPTAAPIVSDTRELTWTVPATNQGILTLSAPRAKFVLGHADDHHFDLGHNVSVTLGKTSNSWCTLSLTLLEGDTFDKSPRRALLAATGHIENTGMRWKDPARTSVGKDWGQTPSLVEVIPATLHLPRPLSGATPTVYPLTAAGQRQPTPLPMTTTDSNCSFQIGAPNATLWYEVSYSKD